MQPAHHIELPWQQAVYTRRGPRDPFTFSHVKTVSVTKTLCPSLSVPDLQAHPKILQRNDEAMQEATVLVLVTGSWAQEYSLAGFTANYHPAMRSHERIAPVKYDHLERLGARSNKCSELSSEFSSVQFHSTMAHYVSGEGHLWRLGGCIPFQSEYVVLPRVLEISRMKNVMRLLHMAIRKSLNDSIYVAGTSQYCERSLGLMRKPPFPELIQESPAGVLE
jgi:hypothetical protein